MNRKTKKADAGIAFISGFLGWGLIILAGICAATS